MRESFRKKRASRLILSSPSHYAHSYDDGGPNLPLCVSAQRYHASHNHKTRVEAAGLLTTSETKQLAGVSSLAIAPELLHALAQTEEEMLEIEKESLYVAENEQKALSGQSLEQKRYINDKKAFKADFAKGCNGKGKREIPVVS